MTGGVGKGFLVACDAGPLTLTCGKLAICTPCRGKVLPGRLQPG